MTEIDIWRAAYLMLWWYGDTAQEESARRADEFAADGDPTGEACWLRIIDAIGQLPNTHDTSRVSCADVAPIGSGQETDLISSLFVVLT
jgi:hypothetical protein